MSISNTLFRFALAFSFFSFSFALLAEPTLEEVVVSARKVDESVQDVPIAMSVFTSSDISDAGIERPEDFIALTPNVVMANTVNVGDTLVTIRGLTSTRDAESNFAFVVDGVLQTNPNAFNRELLDIAQIEVLKGPQGALYGRNATSGAILITTKAPSEESESTAVIGMGVNNASKLQYVNSGKMGDNVYTRFSVSTRETDGEHTNVYSNLKNVDFFEDTTLRGRVLVEEDDSSWDFRFGMSEASGGTINFNAVFALPAFQGFGTPGADQFFKDVNEHKFSYMFNVPPVNEQETSDLSIKYTEDLASGREFSAIFAYNHLEEFLMSDGTSGAFGGYFGVPACAASNTASNLALINSLPPGFSFAAPGTAPSGANSVLGPYLPHTCDGYQFQSRDQDDISIEVKLTSNQTEATRWLIGGYYAEIDRDVAVSYGADLGKGFEFSSYVPATGKNPTDLAFDDTFTTDVFSIFGQYSIDLSDATELSLEGRYDKEKRSVDNNVPARSSALYYGGGAPINPAMTAGGSKIPSRDKSYDQFQPKISLTTTAENTTIYASYGVGFRSGGFNSSGSAALINSQLNIPISAGLGVSDSFNKEVSKSFEVGFKGRYLDGRLAINGALFETEVDDNQFFEFFAGPWGLLRVVTSIDQLDISGSELDFKYALTDSIKLDGGIGYTDGEIKKNAHRPNTVGNNAPLAPEHTYNLGMQYETSFSANYDLIVRVDYMEVGETWFHTVQDNKQPAVWGALLGFPVDSDMSKSVRDAYSLVDLRASLVGEKLSLTLWGRNINDEEYLAEVIPAPEFGGSFIHQAPYATYGLDLKYNF
ncbi:TonB-dependent receptor [Gammaproteobacteria bacterium]|jgi:iron complex outermembrane receptor protein|nr:TonB-dependent receptor [Pseudomonadota bacterium]MDA9023450.1 TonB-dependent receptor [Gammaproteobacteria bacterium]MDA9174925.1 TonB-dependent receptor [Gammaproteobacteria bacterium]MDA9979455.1 TonB-dependent receptor [Gammaproteobacteria bacterium]MDB9737647.1 TonB-dependent receptor [Gammaproteobacteria bacterium]